VHLISYSKSWRRHLLVSSPLPNQNPENHSLAACKLSSIIVSIRVARQNSGSRIFLNCTKNTELTPLPFARTFSFALHQKIEIKLSQQTQPKIRTGMRPQPHRNLSPSSFIIETKLERNRTGRPS
jgi:hypothetical protein